MWCLKLLGLAFVSRLLVRQRLWEDCGRVGECVVFLCMCL
jgi:hypothetical protein